MIIGKRERKAHYKGCNFFSISSPMYQSPNNCEMCNEIDKIFRETKIKKFKLNTVDYLAIFTVCVIIIRLLLGLI